MNGPRDRRDQALERGIGVAGVVDRENEGAILEEDRQRVLLEATRKIDKVEAVNLDSGEAIVAGTPETEALLAAVREGGYEGRVA